MEPISAFPVRPGRNSGKDKRFTQEELAQAWNQMKSEREEEASQAEKAVAWLKQRYPQYRVFKEIVNPGQAVRVGPQPHTYRLVIEFHEYCGSRPTIKELQVQSESAHFNRMLGDSSDNVVGYLKFSDPDFSKNEGFYSVVIRQEVDTSW